MSLEAKIIFAVAASIPLLAVFWVYYAPRNTKRDPKTPGWRVVTRQFGRELRTKAMPKERALGLASRLILGSVRVVRLDNDAAGTTMTLAEIRASMEETMQNG